MQWPTCIWRRTERGILQRKRKNSKGVQIKFECKALFANAGRLAPAARARAERGGLAVATRYMRRFSYGEAEC
jgi:hypothetical protein